MDRKCSTTNCSKHSKTGNKLVVSDFLVHRKQEAAAGVQPPRPLSEREAAQAASHAAKPGR